MLNRLWQAHLRRQDRKLWRAVSGELGVEYAEPIARGTIEGMRVEIEVLERNRPTRIDTGLPATIGFSRRSDAPEAAKFGDMWFDASVALRGDLAFWLRALDRPSRKSLDDLVQYCGATLRDGTLTMHESLRSSVTNPTVPERVTPIQNAIALVKRLRVAVASTDDSALFAACKQGSQRERLTAITLVRTQRPDDPRSKALIAELDAATAPDAQFLAALSSARWARIAELAATAPFASRLWFETIETLRTLYPKVETLPEVVALDAAFRDRTTPIAPDKYAATVGLGMSIAIAHTAFYDVIDREPQSRAQIVAALKAICAAL